MLRSECVWDIAVDPGTVGTGFAIFQNRRFHECGTIWPKGKDRIKKLSSLKESFRELLTRLSDNGVIRHIAVESWHKHIAGSKTHGMMLCSEARGVLISVALNYTDSVSYISKGKAPKTEAQMLAKAHGCEGSEHALDALHLGILAGYEK